MRYIAIVLMGALCASAAEYCVKSENGALRITEETLSLTAPRAGMVNAAGGGEFWALYLETATDPPLREPRTIILQREQTPKFETLPDGSVRLSYAKLRKDKKEWNISLAFEFKAVGEHFEITGEVVNNARGWRVVGMDGPVLTGIDAELPKHSILLPEGFGIRINQAPTKERPGKWTDKGGRWEVTHTWNYPSCYGSMQWMEFAGESNGFYYACHDKAHTAKRFYARYYPDSGKYGAMTENRFFVEAGARRALPTVALMSYEGNWQRGAKLYRDWYAGCHPAQKRQQWVTDTTGWLLAILKQQNGEIMWRYDDLGELAELTKARGLDILGIFGWSHGGHDNLYPDDRPDPLMGGEEALKRGLAECRKRGVKTILYANGQLQQRNDTVFWREIGKDLTVEKRDGSLYYETYHKYKEVPVFIFELACLKSEAWYRQMLHLAKQAEALGADGIIFDQLAITRPMECYGKGHGHDEGPVMTYEDDRALLLHRLTEEMHKINPDFTLITEGLNDSNLADVTLFHCCQTGGFRISNSEMIDRLAHSWTWEVFPEMVRVAQPQMITTVRVPTPASDRAMVNYTALYGFRTDIESRYGPDVPYLRNGKIPVKADYGTVTCPPDFQLMSSAPAAEHVRYMKAVNEMLHANAKLILEGTFTEREGFELTSEKPLAAAGYRAADGTFGVMLWNPHSTPLSYKVTSGGKAPRETIDPEHGACENGTIAAGSIRLLIF